MKFLLLSVVVVALALAVVTAKPRRDGRGRGASDGNGRGGNGAQNGGSRHGSAADGNGRGGNGAQNGGSRDGSAADGGVNDRGTQTRGDRDRHPVSFYVQLRVVRKTLHKNKKVCFNKIDYCLYRSSRNQTRMHM